MIIGNGQLANVFQDCKYENIVIFASGVSDSGCTDVSAFGREKSLLLKTLEEYRNTKFVYFSSCALSARDYPKNEYYKHKEEMESIIRQQSKSYYIFRIPQLFGKLKNHKTLINFIYESILHDKQLNIYNNAYRYVIEIEDVKKLIKTFLKFSHSCITIDLANPYRYKVSEIVEIFEKLLNKKASYTVIQKEDQYELELDDMLDFIKKHSLDFEFGKKYLEKKLKEKIAKLEKK